MTQTTPLKYPGSKIGLSKIIIDLMPTHKCYVEVFGGSGAVLFNKPRSEIEVYNDLSGDIVNFFKVLRDNPDALQERLENTPYARKTWEEARDMIRNQTYKNEVDWAWAVFVAHNQSMGGVITDKRGGWGFGRVRNPTPDFTGRLDQVAYFKERLRGVLIEALDFREVFDKYDAPETVFYLDPPYVPETRAVGTRVAYHEEMSELDHIDFVNRVLTLRGKVIISGYDHEVYKPFDNKLTKIIIPVKSSLRSDGRQVIRNEIIWCSAGITIGYKQLAMEITR